MRALHWNGRELRLDSSYSSPKADDRTALIRVHLAGICATDLQILKGYMGFEGVRARARVRRQRDRRTGGFPLPTSGG